MTNSRPIAHVPSLAYWIGCSILLCTLLAGISPVQVIASESQLVKILRARTEATQAFQADVQITETDGAGRKALSTAMLRMAENMRTRTDFPAANVKSFAERAESMGRTIPPNIVRYHYFTKVPAQFRLELLNGDGNVRDWMVYTGDSWQIYTPGKGKRENQMDVSRNGYLHPPLEVARGQALWFDVYAKILLKASPRNKALEQMFWGEFLDQIAPGEAVDFQESLPSGGGAKPLLQITTGIHKGTKGLGGYRLRLWFDPEHDYHPLRMECRSLVFEPGTGHPSYNLDIVTEWSGFQTFLRNVTAPKVCVIRRFRQFPTVVDGADSKDWPMVSYELAVQTFRFSNIRINPPLDDSHFDLKTPPVTYVVDRVAGFKYSVGKSGEILNKSALQMAVNVPPRNETRKDSLPLWQRLLLYGGLPLLGAATAFQALRWWSRRRRRA